MRGTAIRAAHHPYHITGRSSDRTRVRLPTASPQFYVHRYCRQPEKPKRREARSLVRPTFRAIIYGGPNSLRRSGGQRKFCCPVFLFTLTLATLIYSRKSHVWGTLEYTYFVCDN